MKIVCLSDTHCRQGGFTVPDGDVLVHTGDMALRGHFEEVADALAWLGGLPHPHKVVIAGNHDWAFQRCVADTRAECSRHGLHYLQDSGVELDGVRFWGSPWQPEFCNWAFNLPRNGPELREVWARIPEDTDVLLTHGPPYGVRDVVERRMPDGARYTINVGCEMLRRRVDQLNLKLHVFGHIHEGHGIQQKDGGTMFVNAAVCTRRYHPTNDPIVVHL